MPPTDRQIFEGEIATYWLDDGILISLSKSPRRTVANITANIELVRRISNNKKISLLIQVAQIVDKFMVVTPKTNDHIKLSSY